MINNSRAISGRPYLDTVESKECTSSRSSSTKALRVNTAYGTLTTLGGGNKPKSTNHWEKESINPTKFSKMLDKASQSRNRVLRDKAKELKEQLTNNKVRIFAGIHKGGLPMAHREVDLQDHVTFRGGHTVYHGGTKPAKRPGSPPLLVAFGT